MKVVILTVPESTRAIPLVRTLQSIPNLVLQQFPAIMYQQGSTGYSPDFDSHLAFYGRRLLDGEIGCAISHQRIWVENFAAGSPIVVLEDDARIPDPQAFMRLVDEFAKNYREENAVLSLLPWMSRPERTCSYHSDENREILSLVGRTPLTVGYVITAKAMKELALVNRNFSFLPDWPLSSTKFFTSVLGVIQHGDHLTYSLINMQGDRKSRSRRIFHVITFISFFSFRKSYNNSVAFYIRQMLWPSISWRIDNSRIRLFLFIRLRLLDNSLGRRLLR
jgi:GR25 family glycosyltransferase involved in LPS biosynthesis